MPKAGDKQGDGGDGGNGFTFKRYELSDKKPFDRLFFKEKNSLLKLIDDFEVFGVRV